MFILLTPIFSMSTVYAAPSIVPNCNTGPLIFKLDSNGKETTEKVFANPCDFNYVMLLINNVIEFLLFYLATPLAGLALCYSGGLMLFSGGSSEKLTKAKAIIKNVVIGYIIALAAWLIVSTIFKQFGFTGETFLK